MLTNGKMTFRFDTGTGKDGQAGKSGGRESGRGSLGTASDYSADRNNSADGDKSPGRISSVDGDYSVVRSNRTSWNSRVDGDGSADRHTSVGGDYTTDGNYKTGGEYNAGGSYKTGGEYSADGNNKTGKNYNIASYRNAKANADANVNANGNANGNANANASADVWPYDTAGEPAGRDQHVGRNDRGFEPGLQPVRYVEWETSGRSSGSVSSESTFFRAEPVTDLWDKSPRRIPDNDAEDQYGYNTQYCEPPEVEEPREFGDISYSGLGYGSGGYYQTRRPARWWKFALSVAGALGTGLLLGYAALNFISGVNDSADGPANPAAVQNEAAGASGQPVDAATGLPAAGESSAAGRIPVAIAAQSYYLLQYGVFSTPDGAEQAQQELLAAGLAAGTDPDGGNRVYAGMSPDREQAKLLSSGLQHQGIELYVREVTLPAAEQAVFAGQAEAVNSYFAASAELLNELSGLSATLLSGAGGPADTAAVTDLHMKWTEAVKALEPGLSAEGQSLCDGLEKSASQGIAALNEYNKNQAQGLLWEVQESVLSFLAGQKTLLSLLE